MKIIITGCTGNLAKEFIKSKCHTYKIYGISRKQKNNDLKYEHICADPKDINKYIDTIVGVDADCLINNAVMYNSHDPRLENNKVLNEMFINLYLPYTLSTNLYRSWANSKKDKCIINISSTASLHYYAPYQTSYAMMKVAMNRMTEDLSKVFYPIVRVNAVAPDGFPSIVSYEKIISTIDNLINSKKTGKIEILYE